MKSGFLLLIAVTYLMACSSEKTTLTTTAGGSVTIGDKPVALMWLVPDCPLCQAYSTHFVALANNSGSAFTFYGVLPGNLYTSKEVQHFVDSFGFDMPIIADPDYDLTGKYKVSVTPEFLLLDSNASVFYQGKYDDWATDLSQKKIKPIKHYFADAISAFVNKTPLKQSKTQPIGCIIEFD
ncbi:MAG: thioredoxin-related protein [Bacteroidia bacterium]|jgi:thioredoxin-related protein